MRCSEVVGYYVSVEVWSSMIVPAVKTSAGCYISQRSTVPVGPVQCTSCLMVLTACVRGAKRDKLQPYLKVHTHTHTHSCMYIYNMYTVMISGYK